MSPITVAGPDGRALVRPAEASSAATLGTVRRCHILRLRSGSDGLAVAACGDVFPRAAEAVAQFVVGSGMVPTTPVVDVIGLAAVKCVNPCCRRIGTGFADTRTWISEGSLGSAGRSI